MNNQIITFKRASEISTIFQKMHIIIDNNKHEIEFNKEKKIIVDKAIINIQIVSKRLKSKPITLDVSDIDNKLIIIRSRLNNNIIIIENILLVVFLILGLYYPSMQRLFWIWLVIYSLTPIYFTVMKKSDFYIIKNN